MAVLTDDQIAQVAVNNGFSTADTNNLAVCVAIAKAESSGRTDAINSNTNGTNDKGLWQINSVHDSKLPGQDRFDSNVNAQLMMIISSNGSNWQPWSTYNNGAYQQHLGEAISAVSGKQFVPDPGNSPWGGGGSNTQTVSNSNPVSGIEKFFSGLSNPDTITRMGQVWFGGSIILLGIIWYFREPITKAVTSVAEPEASAIMAVAK